MNTTTNYNLYLCDSGEKYFKEWQEEMNGTEDSNMIKIDKALGEKAASSVSIFDTLYADAWIVNGTSFLQTITVAGLSDEHNGNISISNEATTDQFNSACSAMLKISEQRDGELVICAEGELPKVDIPVAIILLG